MLEHGMSHAKKNTLLIFPSWLNHKVGINNSDKDRLSISFNVMLRGRYEHITSLQSVVIWLISRKSIYRGTGIGYLHGGWPSDLSNVVWFSWYMDFYPLSGSIPARMKYISSIKNCRDDHPGSTEESRSNAEWRRFLRDTSRRWRLFRLSNKAVSIHRHTFRCRNADGDNLLRPHLFGVIEWRSYGLGQRSL